MPTAVQFRRGDAAWNNGFTGREGELSLDTSTWLLHVHDGVTAGGHLVAPPPVAGADIALTGTLGNTINVARPFDSNTSALARNIVPTNSYTMVNLTATGTVSATGAITSASNITASGYVNAGASMSAGTFITAGGDIYAFYTSDKSLKTNIAPITSALDKLSQISGVEFDWTDEHLASKADLPEQYRRAHDVGVIAQDVQQVLPEVVLERADGTLSVDYAKMVPLLIQAIKELQIEVNTLKGKKKK
jgi:hypothetical protein